MWVGLSSAIVESETNALSVKIIKLLNQHYCSFGLMQLSNLGMQRVMPSFPSKLEEGSVCVILLSLLMQRK